MLRCTSAAGTSSSYNAAGDLLNKTSGGQTTSYQYDQLGNLLRVQLPDGTTITYVVDGLGRRVGKKVNGTLVKGFLYADSDRPVAELDGAGLVTSRFVYSGEKGASYMIQGGVSFQFVTDQVGSVRIVINSATGAIVQRLDYDTFGNVIFDSNPGFQPFGFQGGLHDPDTKLVRFGERDYDAETGRWTIKDPIGFGGAEANLYRFVRNDPVNYIDPSGLATIEELERRLEQLKELGERTAREITKDRPAKLAWIRREREIARKSLEALRGQEARAPILRPLMEIPSIIADVNRLARANACGTGFNEFLRVYGRRTGFGLPLAINLRIGIALSKGEIQAPSDVLNIVSEFVELSDLLVFF